MSKSAGAVVVFRTPLVKISHMNAPAASQSPNIYPAAHKLDSILYTDVYPLFLKISQSVKSVMDCLRMYIIIFKI
jgi:hypothetical protein